MSNLGKYETSNPIKRALLNRFLGRARAAVPSSSEVSVLDVGTGEGLFWEGYGRNVVGVDIRLDALVLAGDKGVVSPVLASAEGLPFPSDSFDFVMAVEILEHLPDPSQAVAELARVTRSSGLVTVPWEPWFSLMVMMGTGQHMRRMGREPEHVQAFGPKQLSKLLSEHFSEVKVATTLPWLVATVSV